MTRLIISVANREASLDQPSGNLYVVDLEEMNVLQKTSGIDPAYREHDHNPRGGMRGVKGISLLRDDLILANYSALFIFDCHWNLLRTITHPLVSSIHEIFYTDDGIWVTSSANDLLVRFDLDGNLCEFDYMRNHTGLMLKIGGPYRKRLNDRMFSQGSADFRDRTYFKADKFDRTHLNGIDITPDGTMFLSLGLIVNDWFGFLIDVKTVMLRLGIWSAFLSINRFLRNMLGLKKNMLSELVAQPLFGSSVIISRRLGEDWQPRVQFQVTQNPSHSPRIMEDGTGFYLASAHGRLVHFDQQGNILSNSILSEKFLRGLLVLPDGRLAIGAGNTLLMYDIERQQVIAQLELSENQNTTIFDIKVLPEHFDLPPASLEERFGRVVGYDGAKVIWDQSSRSDGFDR